MLNGEIIWKASDCFSCANKKTHNLMVVSLNPGTRY